MSVRVCGDGLWSSWGEPHFRRLRADEPGRAQAAPQVLRAPGRSHQRGVPASLLRSRLALTRLLLGPLPAAWPQAPASSLCGRQPGPAGLRAWGLGPGALQLGWVGEGLCGLGPLWGRGPLQGTGGGSGRAAGLPPGAASPLAGCSAGSLLRADAGPPRPPPREQRGGPDGVLRRPQHPLGAAGPCLPGGCPTSLLQPSTPGV